MEAICEQLDRNAPSIALASLSDRARLADAGVCPHYCSDSATHIFLFFSLRAGRLAARTRNFAASASGESLIDSAATGLASAEARWLALLQQFSENLNPFHFALRLCFSCTSTILLMIYLPLRPPCLKVLLLPSAPPSPACSRRHRRHRRRIKLPLTLRCSRAALAASQLMRRRPIRSYQIF